MVAIGLGEKIRMKKKERKRMDVALFTVVNRRRVGEKTKNKEGRGAASTVLEARKVEEGCAGEDEGKGAQARLAASTATAHFGEKVKKGTRKKREKKIRAFWSVF